MAAEVTKDTKIFPSENPSSSSDPKTSHSPNPSSVLNSNKPSLEGVPILPSAFSQSSASRELLSTMPSVRSSARVVDDDYDKTLFATNITTPKKLLAKDDEMVRRYTRPIYTVLKDAALEPAEVLWEKVSLVCYLAFHVTRSYTSMSLMHLNASSLGLDY